MCLYHVPPPSTPPKSYLLRAYPFRTYEGKGEFSLSNLQITVNIGFVTSKGPRIIRKLQAEKHVYLLFGFQRKILTFPYIASAVQLNLFRLAKIDAQKDQDRF